MIQQIIDLHIHSKYSRACSKSLELSEIAKACAIRGVDIVATGDFTHPKWFEHIKTSLVEENEGVYKLKAPTPPTPSRAEGDSETRFIIGTELSCIKKHKDKTRRIHVCVFAPNIEVAEKFNNKLETMGFNLRSDGRPILGLTVKQLLEIMLETDERMIMIPAHAWTPWFGIFGSKGGYNSLEEAFEELTPKIFAIETGLSSDPPMNWRLSKLDKIALVSNSDAHSLEKIGREANVLEFVDEKAITYENIFNVIKESCHVKSASSADHVAGKLLYTIEFFPEEGKYHYDGHANCKFVCAPEESRKLKNICPKCKKELVIGVMNRVTELADRTEEEAKKIKHVPFKSLVPLPEIIADCFNCGVSTKRVKEVYNKLIKKLGNEFNILLNIDTQEIAFTSEPIIGEAVERVRTGKIYVRPGYDGEFGVVKVFSDEERVGKKQIGLEL
ncbi:MAG: and RNA helicase protein [Candidatus Magasanikbacteria bacterium GW2011_GWC2_37_14]|uniref:And RNA helicase protein n=1 Tax=Candidatus Magasanikbacteria bacterium GW2011_GWC2_37_14 TaxID=1619046 RepID=A0A0G0GNQ1_9BACT|nr:MAG: and RNA helicase protein [Candidatus Magasanikbacteria bacterium GW2011_GWC2_37_14]